MKSLPKHGADGKHITDRRCRTGSFDRQNWPRLCALFLPTAWTCFLAVFLFTGSAWGQGAFQIPDFKSNRPFGESAPFGQKSAPEESTEPVTLTADFSANADGTGELKVTAKVAADMHIFSVTQPKGPGVPKRTMIRIDDSDQVELTGEFSPNKDPHRTALPNQNLSSEEHEGEILFTAPLKFNAGVNPENVKITVKYDGQACINGPHGSCFQISESFPAAFAGQQSAPAANIKFQPEMLHALLSGKMTRIVENRPAEGPVTPGDRIKVSITAEPTDGYHFYTYSSSAEKGPGSATLLAIEKTGGWSISGPDASDTTPVTVIEDQESISFYEEPVTWSYMVNVPKNMEESSNTIGGIMLMLTCYEDGCDRPTGIRWAAKIDVGQPLEGRGLRFSEVLGNPVDKVKKAVVNEAELISAGKDGGKWDGASPLFVVPAAFLAGFILNFMPCVLPVIGLKVMSFMHQAGQNPRKVFWLNVVFCMGMLSVFMLLGFFSVQFGLGWGEHFQGLTFKLIMIAVVVVFGLSFFDVWEIPVPGFGGGSLDQKEGIVGAFFKGILTTVLATPCSGPFLASAVVWTFTQPPLMTYMVFAALGLGMGLPYIVLGAMPKLTRHLPKPGPWMETFKKVMGFVMLGTAVFLAGAIESKYIVSLLTMLVILGFACWWMGRTPMTAPLGQRLKSWGTSGLIGAFAVWFSFYVLIPTHELDYKQYTRWTMDQQLKEGRTVLVDFTADW